MSIEDYRTYSMFIRHFWRHTKNREQGNILYIHMPMKFKVIMSRTH